MATDLEIKALARRYTRLIRWSEEDQLYIGSLPDLENDCTHGRTPEETARNLDEVAEMYVAAHFDYGAPLPEPRCQVVVPSTFRVGDTENKVTALRNEWGYTQKNFAALLGVSLSTLTKWEIGERTPSGAAARLLEIYAKHPELVHSR